MSNKRSRKNNRRRDARPKISRAIIVVTLALMCMVGTTMLAHLNSLTRDKQVASEVSVTSLTASKPSREIFAGSRMVASEDGYSISPTYQSFAGNGGAALITVTAPSGANWTAVSNDTSFITITSGSSGTG